MTEQEWLTETILEALLGYLVRGGVTSDRKRRLLVVACCRLVDHLLNHEVTRKALVATERHAEGLIKASTLTRYCRGCFGVYHIENIAGNQAGAIAAWAVHIASQRYAYFGALRHVAAALALEAGHTPETPPYEAAIEESLKALIALVRDIFGNPFQLLPPRDAAWLTASGGLAGRLATGIYEERRFTELPILADALEDAGCQETRLLEHLRGPGPHERGCWALDVVLGKG
jgi:hypothetical protein